MLGHSDDIEYLYKMIDYWKSRVITLKASRARFWHLSRQLKQENNALQAKIDALMLEFCPEEMTQKQLEEWVRTQRHVDYDGETKEPNETTGRHGPSGEANP